MLLDETKNEQFVSFSNLRIVLMPIYTFHTVSDFKLILGPVSTF